jgi:surface protein
VFLHSGCPEQDDPTKAAGGPFCHACPEPIDYFESKAQLRAALMDFEDQSCKYTNCDVVERYGPINEWNVSGVHEFNQLFNGLNRFNEDISGWDTSNVGAMVQTFQYARQFNQVMYIHILIMFLT